MRRRAILPGVDSAMDPSSRPPVFLRYFTCLAIVVTCFAVPREVEAQQRPPARFFINAVGDTTFRFSVPSDPWVKPGAEGLAIDPARRDSLVARFRVARVEWGEAVAVITGQTTAITTEHVALLRMPEAPWYRRTSFWLGVIAGAGAGVGIAAATR
jgi:hypothetical protein